MDKRVDKFNGIDDTELLEEVARRIKHHGRIRTAQRIVIDKLMVRLAMTDKQYQRLVDKYNADVRTIWDRIHT